MSVARAATMAGMTASNSRAIGRRFARVSASTSTTAMQSVPSARSARTWSVRTRTSSDEDLFMAGAWVGGASRPCALCRLVMKRAVIPFAGTTETAARPKGSIAISSTSWVASCRRLARRTGRGRETSLSHQEPSSCRAVEHSLLGGAEVRVPSPSARKTARRASSLGPGALHAGAESLGSRASGLTCVAPVRAQCRQQPPVPEHLHGVSTTDRSQPSVSPRSAGPKRRSSEPSFPLFSFCVRCHRCPRMNFALRQEESARARGRRLPVMRPRKAGPLHARRARYPGRGVALRNPGPTARWALPARSST